LETEKEKMFKNQVSSFELECDELDDNDFDHIDTTSRNFSFSFLLFFISFISFFFFEKKK